MLRYLYYIRYFLYIAWNWNVKLAFFTLYHESKGERKYHLDTTRLQALTRLTLTGSNARHAEIYQGASYFLLENVFARLRTLHPGTAFTDMGCGRGRALVVAAYYGFTSITGVDFAQEMCREAARNCASLQIKLPLVKYRVVHADAARYPIEKETDTIYFFNPFDAVVMQQVINNISASLQKAPRVLFVVYINPQYKQLFCTPALKKFIM